ncbi:hypothetical protein EK21DRAFT_90801 [Setomelanomma holmii]|uniref:Uncharacterized protein n=1 Tax=Setomelanomma holmii TaxID=210430 RepID=A0A9P4H635_9PLEO|nr:hypothetical protein EK21DRAFT_90801 [Setomelanomma holmii]
MRRLSTLSFGLVRRVGLAGRRDHTAVGFGVSAESRLPYRLRGSQKRLVVHRTGSSVSSSHDACDAFSEIGGCWKPEVVSYWIPFIVSWPFLFLLLAIELLDNSSEVLLVPLHMNYACNGRYRAREALHYRIPNNADILQHDAARLAPPATLKPGREHSN